MEEINQDLKEISLPKRIWKDIKLLKNMLDDKEFQISSVAKALIIGTLIYVFAPTDTIPDVVPFLGWTDDIALVVWTIEQISSEIVRYKQLKIMI